MGEKEGRWEWKRSMKISGSLGQYWEVELTIGKAFRTRVRQPKSRLKGYIMSNKKGW